MKASKSFPAVGIRGRVIDPYSQFQVWRKCERKNSYPDQAFAERVLTRREAAGARGLKTYLCTVCGKWHLGHRK